MGKADIGVAAKANKAVSYQSGQSCPSGLSNLSQASVGLQDGFDQTQGTKFDVKEIRHNTSFVD